MPTQPQYTVRILPGPQIWMNEWMNEWIYYQIQIQIYKYKYKYIT